jgi:uroporphyrinogen-III decarboxylase
LKSITDYIHYTTSRDDFGTQTGPFMSARGMEPEKLKQAYGNQITFWGGIDTQHILPKGTPTQAKQEVYKVMKTIASNGGYVLAPAHYIQPDAPPENIWALFEAGREYFKSSSNKSKLVKGKDSNRNIRFSKKRIIGNYF